MKKRIAIAIVTASVLTSCVTQFRVQNVTNTQTSSYRKGGTEFIVTRTYTSTVKIDTVKINK